MKVYKFQGNALATVVVVIVVADSLEVAQKIAIEEDSLINVEDYDIVPLSQGVIATYSYEDW